MCIIKRMDQEMTAVLADAEAAIQDRKYHAAHINDNAAIEFTGTLNLVTVDHFTHINRQQ